MDEPKHSLGQHWLYDDDSLDAMVAAADIGPDDTVLEIGPGLGTLTKKLVARARQVIAIEVDPDLARELPNRVPADNLTVLAEDFLQFDLATLPADYKVAANLPYYVTSPILRKLCTAKNSFSQASLLVQKEVAERVCAKPGGRSLMSVAVQFYAETDKGLVVPAELFTPPPKVDSEILILKHYGKPLFPDVEPKLFFRIVKAGFSQRRKVLLNSLSAGMRLSRAEANEWLARANIDPARRPQTLGMAEWFDIYRAYTATRS